MKKDEKKQLRLRNLAKAAANVGKAAMILLFIAAWIICPLAAHGEMGEAWWMPGKIAVGILTVATLITLWWYERK